MAEEKPFRVLLDLSELNLNVSKYVWMNVSPRELNNIADFRNAVVKKLNFDRRDFKLFVHDGLLPDDEKIIILRENDTVKLLYDDPSENGNFNASICELNSSRFSYSERNSSDFIEEKGSSKKRKRKSDIASDVAEESNESLHKAHEKKKKHKKSSGSCASEEKACDIASDVAEESNESLHKAHKKKKKHKKSSSSSVSEEKTYCIKSNEQTSPEFTVTECNIDNVPVISIEVDKSNGNAYNGSTSECELLEPTDDISGAFGNNCKKRKRKRHKRRRNVPEAVQSMIPSDASTTLMKNTPSTFSDKFSSIRKHIKFTSPTPSIDATNSETVEIVDLNTYVKKFKSESPLDISETAFKTPDSPANKSIPSHKNSTPSQTYLKQNSWSVSPMRCESSMEIEQPSKIENNKNSSVKKKAVKLTFADYPSLNCLPCVGMHIAFKTLELDENYSPAVTPYKEGIIRNVDHTTEALDIELVSAEIKPGRAGKFENLARDEIPQDQYIKSVTLNWSSLIDPRCITEDKN